MSDPVVPPALEQLLERDRRVAVWYPEALAIVAKYAPGELGLANHLTERFAEIAAASAADRVSALTSLVEQWQQLVTDILVRVQNGQSQSIGSIDSHRAPQIGVDEIKRWWTEVERLVDTARLDPAERPAPDPKS